MDGYTTKEVLFSTKDKLKELETKLRKLKELSYIKDDKNIESVSYDILYLDKKEKPELRCVIDYNPRNLRGIIKNIEKRFQIYSYGAECGRLTRDNNGRCYIFNDNYRIIIPREHDNLFGDIADEILEDEFVDKFLRNDYLLTDDTEGALKIYTNAITMQSDFGRFTFYPSEATARLEAQEGIELSNINIENLLNIRLSKNKFNDYQRSIIDSSKEKDKEIVIPSFGDTYKKLVKKARHFVYGEVNFEVKEDEKRLYLIRK